VVRQPAQGEGFLDLQLGDVLPHIIVQRQEPVPRQKEDGRGGELLRHGADLAHHERCHRHPVFEARHAVAATVQHLSVPADTHDAAGRLAGVPFRERRVDLPRERITVSRGKLCFGSPQR